MLMTTAAVHMDSAHGHGPPPSSSTSPAPPWLPVLADENHHHQLLCDFTASSAPSTTPATAAATNRHHLRSTATATRRTTKRRPRPSRKLPTTYITADPASFRRMVHQVTGADDLPLPVTPPVPPEALRRPAPYRAGAAGTLMLPTLDTSAFLLGAPGVAAPCAGSAGSAAAAAVDRAEAGGPAGGACNYSGSNSGSSCGGFPTLDSWDAHLF
ncbi:calmodulin-binding protein 25-like [Panicum miliaceum]|uniref:Calmodulin-binding protein 25-like n=1 Tax=Panicum miliaceum TaxID=4540 RepID=A0A3L6SYZ3_PANMI|nr:calmodulin-binding protein 25-like [Panicum miliaceum]